MSSEDAFGLAASKPTIAICEVWSALVHKLRCKTYAAVSAHAGVADPSPQRPGEAVRLAGTPFQPRRPS